MNKSKYITVTIFIVSLLLFIAGQAKAVPLAFNIYSKIPTNSYLGYFVIETDDLSGQPPASYGGIDDIALINYSFNAGGLVWNPSTSIISSYDDKVEVNYRWWSTPASPNRYYLDINVLKASFYHSSSGSSLLFTRFDQPDYDFLFWSVSNANGDIITGGGHPPNIDGYTIKRVPEPAAFALLGFGLVVLGFSWRGKV